MSQWVLSGVVTAIGAVVLLAGLALVPGEESLAAAPEPAPAATTTSSGPSPSTTVPATPAVSTTTIPPTTALAPSTTEVKAETVEEFVVRFNQALDEDDVDTLLSRLHPVVVDAFGADLCRSWVEREIVELSDYRLSGEVSGPSTRTVQTPRGSSTVPEAYEVPVSFVFQGETFDTNALFGMVDGQVHWLGECR